MLKIVIAILLLCATAAQAADLSGKPIVIDGDTLKFGGSRVRIHGIDAPELRQSCDGLPKAGRLAQETLRAAVKDGVWCMPLARTDRYGRTVARCMGAGGDLAEIMVRSGMAWDAPKYSRGAYRAAEADARKARRGIHGARCVPPGDWRKGVR